MKRAMVLAGITLALVVSVAYAADPKLVISAAENNMAGTSTNVTVTLTDGAFNFNNDGTEIWIDGVKLSVPPSTITLNQVNGVTFYTISPALSLGTHDIKIKVNLQPSGTVTSATTSIKVAKKKQTKNKTTTITM